MDVHSYSIGALHSRIQSMALWRFHRLITCPGAASEGLPGRPMALTFVVFVKGRPWKLHRSTRPIRSWSAGHFPGNCEPGYCDNNNKPSPICRLFPTNRMIYRQMVCWRGWLILDPTLMLETKPFCSKIEDSNSGCWN